MKYYLIKVPENHLIYVEGERNREAKCEELKMIVHVYDYYESNLTAGEKIKKVL